MNNTAKKTPDCIKPVDFEETVENRTTSKDFKSYKDYINSISLLPEEELSSKLCEMALDLVHMNPFLIDEVADLVKRRGLSGKTEFVKKVKSIQAIENRKKRLAEKSSIPTETDLVERWINYQPYTIYTSKKIRRYQGGIWQELPWDEIKQELFAIMAEAEVDENLHFTSYKLESVFDLIKIKIFDKKDMDTYTNLIPLRNGVYDLDAMKFLPHDPSYRFTYCLDFDYDKKADCPNYKKMLSRIPKWRKTLKKFAGYCLTIEAKYETAIWLYGPPGCGKSALLRGLEFLLGPLAGELSLHDIQVNRFYLQKIRGKRYAISTEIPDHCIMDADTLIKLISSETLPMEGKYENPFSDISYAKIAWASNELPRIRNYTNNGLSRRMIFMDISPLPEEERDVDLLSKLKNERSGIFNFALEGLKILREENGFREDFKLSRSIKDLNLQLDPFSVFFEERCNVMAGKREQSSNLYNAYLDFCSENGVMPYSMKRLAKDWYRKGLTNKEIDGKYYWYGICLKE
jgi:putative DNA primase/helicase